MNLGNLFGGLDIDDLIEKSLQQFIQEELQGEDTPGNDPAVEKALEGLPGWAKRKIRLFWQTSDEQSTMLSYNNNSLTITNGEAFYNGRLIRRPSSDGTEEQSPTTVSFADLPDWAQNQIRKAKRGSLVQMTWGKSVLQINGQGTFFNGLEVVEIK